MPKKKSAASALRTTPWRRRTADGVYFGHSGSVWAYYELPLAPLKWEDGVERIKQGSMLDLLLTELGETSVDVANGLAALAALREVHVFCASFEEPLELPETGTEAHAELLGRVLPAVAADKTLLVGVKLWNQVKRGVARGGAGAGAVSSMWKQTKTVLARDVDSEDSFAPYRDDHHDIADIMRRCGAAAPRPAALAQLESWFNFGAGPDAQVLAAPTELHVTHGGSWEISTVTEFERPTLTAPDATWLMDAMTHPDPAVAVSIRGELLPATVLRAQLRTSQRKLRAQEEEEAKTGDISRDEISERSNLAKDLENRVQAEGRAWLSKTSILMARAFDVHDDAGNSYRDALRNSYGIETKPLEHRQIRALEEMQPCANVRANPFDQTISIPLVAYAGLPSFSNIGDPGPLWLGQVDPDGSPVFVEAAGAPRNNKPPVMAIFGDPGSGKAQPLSARILTPTGWSTMGQIRVGDDVIGKDGQTVTVTGVFPQGVMAVYRVTFNDGSRTEVTGNHLWSVATSGRLAKGHDWQVRTTDELRAAVLDGQGKRQWRIPIADPVDRDDADLPLDPYLLGALLGDGGMTSRLSFSSADPEVIDEVRRALPSGVRLRHVAGHDHQVVRVAPSGSNLVTDALRGLGLMGHRSTDKFVPEAYKWGSIAQRFALLQGLLDTDGTLAKHGSVIFYSSSEQLTSDVVELVQSLGGTARVRSKIPTYTHRGEKREGVRAYRATICLPNSFGAPFRLPRKRDAWAPRALHLPSRAIAEISYVRDDEAQCISVSADDRLYVTDDYIVTHNTYAAQLLAGQAALSGTQTIMINPKGFDSLRAFADWVAESGTPATVVSLSAMENENGAFDPFRFAEPRMAAEILNRHILTVLGIEHSGGLTGAQEIELGAGLVRGAEAGALCAYDALQHVGDQSIIDLVVSQARASSIFRLGFGFSPQPPFTAEGRGLTLIEFDRNLPFPEPGMPPGREERIAVGAMRLVTRASMEILMRSGGGVMVVDEAHHYLNSAEGTASLQRLGREGRSLGLLPIFLTQRVSDLLGAEMENYLSRVLVMKLTDAHQADAALRLCGLKPTQARIDFLREAGPRKPSNGQPGRPSFGFFRDIHDRHAVVSIGPNLPEDIRLAFSTNPDDRKKRAQLLAETAGRTAAPSEEPTT